MYVHNGRYNGPPSETLSFDTPEGGNTKFKILYMIVIQDFIYV